MTNALLLLSGDNEEAIEERRTNAYQLAAERLSGNSRATPGPCRYRYRGRYARPGSDEVILGSFSSLLRKAKNVTKKAAHVGLQTARAAKQVSTGDISGALNRAISTVTGGKSGSVVVTPETSAEKTKAFFSSWKGYSVIGGGSIITLLILIKIAFGKK